MYPWLHLLTHSRLNYASCLLMWRDVSPNLDLQTPGFWSPQKKQHQLCRWFQCLQTNDFSRENWGKIPFSALKHNIWSQAMFCQGGHMWVFSKEYICTHPGKQDKHVSAWFSFDSYQRISTLRPQHLKLSEFFTPCTSARAVLPPSARIWHRRVIEKSMKETPLEDVNYFQKKPYFKGLHFHLEVSSNIYWKIKQALHPIQGHYTNHQSPKALIALMAFNQFPSISQFRLGCLDLFRSKASLIISRASRCSTPAVPALWRKIQEAGFV